MKISLNQNIKEFVIINLLKKKVKILFAVLMLPLFMYSQSVSNTIFTYKSPHYYESINLIENGKFIYNNKTEFIKIEIRGNWQVRNDSILVLDSSPQKSKLIVFESRKNDKKNTFRVRDMNNHQIHYNLCLITNENDTIEFKDQFDKSTILGDFSSFYIVDTKGQYSPIYNIEGLNSNFFDIFYEHRRVFDNEYWKYYGEYLIPLGTNGKYQNYKLNKE